MNKIAVRDFNLNMTLLGGQSFCWDYDGSYFYGFTSARIIKLKQGMDYWHWQTYPVLNDIKFIKEYFRLRVKYNKIISVISKDKYVNRGIQQYPGLRLLKQPFCDTVISFIISANNNIKAIRKSIRILSRMYGKRIKVDDKYFYLFPKIDKLANARLSGLKNSRIGFRAKYVKNAARCLVASGLEKRIDKMSENQIRTELINLPGVGDKVADCTLCYGVALDDVMPLDVWGRRILSTYCGLSPKLSYNAMRVCTRTHFGGYAAWAGQFLFEYIRHNFRK